MIPVLKFRPNILTQPEFAFPTFVAAGTADSDGPTSSFLTLTPGKPSGVRSFDFLVCLTTAVNGRITTDPGSPTITPPAGFTEIRLTTHQSRTTTLSWAVAGSEEPSTYDVLVQSPVSSSGTFGYSVILAYRYVAQDKTNLDPLTSVSGFIDISSTTPTISVFSGFTLPEPACLAFRFAANTARPANGGGAATQPTSSGLWVTDFSNAVKFDWNDGTTEWDVWLGLFFETKIFEGKASYPSAAGIVSVVGAQSYNWAKGTSSAIWGGIRPLSPRIGLISSIA